MLQAATWNTIGLCVAATYVALGANWCFKPPVGSFDAQTDNDTRDLVSSVAVRDVCFGIALVGLCRGRGGSNAAAGTLILSTMPLCMWDALIVWRRNRKEELVSNPMHSRHG